MKLVLKVFPSHAEAKNHYREDLTTATGDFIKSDSRQLVIEYGTKVVRYIAGGLEWDAQRIRGFQPDKVSYPCGIMGISPVVRHELEIRTVGVNNG